MVRTNILLPLLAGAGAVLGQRTIVPGAYIVEFEDSQDPADFYSHADTLSETQMTFDSSLFKGASIRFTNIKTADVEASNMLTLPSVKNVWPMGMHSLPNDEVIYKGENSEFIKNVKRQNGNDTFTPHVMTQVDKLRAKGIVGTGIKIGIIDTGVDYNHPALGGCFGPGCLVGYGTDLVGDAYTGTNTPVPDDDPLDQCAGHGTHVSGIIAAQTNSLGFTGAAPGVTLGMFRVFGCTGSAGDDVLIAAYLKAFEAGSQIITASIGGSSGWSEEPWAVVVSRIVKSGVPCTVSAGNSGDVGLFYASTAADGKKVTAIASFDNIQSPALLVTSSYTVDDGSSTDFGYALGSPGNWSGVNLPLWTASFNVTDPAGGCDPYPASTPDLSGKIVLIRRGTCTFVQKATNAAAFGAKYIMFYNNVQGANAADVAVTGIEAVGMTTAAQGVTWVTALQAGSDVVLSMLDPVTAPIILTSQANTLTGGYLSTYTSWGPTFEADVKPQFGSPGGNILSTYPIALGSYAVLSGTSMACPIVAAIYALVAEVRNTFDPATIENLLAATANPQLFNDGTGSYPVLAPVAQQGAGLVQAYDAAYATTLLSTSSLAFNDSDHFVSTQNFTVFNLGTEEVTYTLGSVGAATAYTFSTSIVPDIFPGLDVDDSYATIGLSETTLTIAAGSKAVVEVTVTPPAVDAARLPVYSGFITLNGTNGDSLSLLYQGIVGSLHAATVLNSTYLSLSTDANLTPITGSNSTFLIPKNNATLANATLPVATASFAFGSPLLNVEVIALPAGTNLGNVLGFPVSYLSRDPISDPWDGQLADGSYAPAGKYAFKISALHINGDVNNTADYDVGQTAEFNIRYTY